MRTPAAIFGMLIIMCMAACSPQQQAVDDITDDGGCIIGGCSGQLCIEEGDDGVSTCEFREEYACYKTATCERQQDGQCGWTQTDELTSCLQNPPSMMQDDEQVSSDSMTDDPMPKDDTMMDDSAMTNDAIYADYTASVLANGETKVLFFHAAWCPVCRTADTELKDWYADGTPTRNMYKVDYDTSLELKSKYGITYQHTFVLVDGEGNALETVQGPTDAQLKTLIGA